MIRIAGRSISPRSPVSYELHLYFAEVIATLEPEGDVSKRVFNVIINGKTALQYFDPVSDATGLNERSA